MTFYRLKVKGFRDLQVILLSGSLSVVSDMSVGRTSLGWGEALRGV